MASTPSTFAPRPEAAVAPGSLLFVGSLDWRPNLDAVTYFLDEIQAPLLERLVRTRASRSWAGTRPAWLVKRVAAEPG